MTELKKMYAQETEQGRKEHIMQAMQQLQRAKRGAPSILEPSEQAQNEILTDLRAPMMRKQAAVKLFIAIFISSKMQQKN